MEERYHTANVVEAFNLGAQGCFLMKITTDEVTILLRCYPTHSMNTDTAGMSYHLANHVLRHFVFVSTDRKVSISPLIQIFAIEWNRKDSWNTFTKLLMLILFTGNHLIRDHFNTYL